MDKHAWLAEQCGRLLLVLDLAIKDGKITRIDVISERARLEQLDFAILDD